LIYCIIAAQRTDTRSPQNNRIEQIVSYNL